MTDVKPKAQACLKAEERPKSRSSAEYFPFFSKHRASSGKSSFSAERTGPAGEVVSPSAICRSVLQEIQRELLSDLFNSWTLIIRKYSALKLTFPQDRLAAISGVAIELQRATGVRYLAGLWNHERLPSFLLWRTEMAFSERCMRPDEPCAPSWSWAAIDEGVIFQHSKVALESFEIVDVWVSGDFDRPIGIASYYSQAKRSRIADLA
ncbi:hypothetical protein HYQ46_012149 [Verticillium longisporum]|nr:hypothetical protein HYQ46_012149 [Verticillium longisporum]